MRFVHWAIAALLLGSSFALTQAQEVEEKPKITLKVGDPAPALEPTKWVAGEAVKSFEPGKYYVVEFWATWCGPCVVMMPHLGDLQHELGPKGLTIIGFSATDPGNTPEQIETFVKKRGDKLGYTVAYADNRDTYNAYMEASGQQGIPCSYVIDKEGKIAYIGHPLFLDTVLPKVLDGTWEPVSGTAELKAADKRWDDTWAAIRTPGKTPEAIDEQLAKWEAFNADWPKLANDPYMNNSRLGLYVAGKKLDDAIKLAKSILTKAEARNDIAAYSAVAAAFTAPEALGEKQLVSIAISAAEAAMKIDGETMPALIRITKAYSAAGDKAKVAEYGAKAITAAKEAVKGENDIFGTLNIASAYFTAGDKENAKATAEKAVEMIDAKNEGMRSYVEQQAQSFGAEIKKPEPKKASPKKVASEKEEK